MRKVFVFGTYGDGTPWLSLYPKDELSECLDHAERYATNSCYTPKGPWEMVGELDQEPLWHRKYVATDALGNEINLITVFIRGVYILY